jgi:stalled ribosome rescue protein Dom34
MTPKPYRRGYPVAVLAGIEQNTAAIWIIYSQVAKPDQTIRLEGTRSDAKALYSFHEAIINALRPTLKEGVKSIIIASPQKTSYSQDFMTHVKGHHAWLFSGANKATFKLLVGSAVTHAQVSSLTSSGEFKQSVSDSTLEETENIRELVEKRLIQPERFVLFSLEEAEDAIYGPEPPVGKPKPEYLLLTDKYLAGEKRKGRLNRLMQIAQNKKIKTRIVNAESPAGARLNQLGGLVCLLK